MSVGIRSAMNALHFANPVKIMHAMKVVQEFVRIAKRDFVHSVSHMLDTIHQAVAKDALMRYCVRRMLETLKQ